MGLATPCLPIGKNCRVETFKSILYDIFTNEVKHLRLGRIRLEYFVKLKPMSTIRLHLFDMDQIGI